MTLQKKIAETIKAIKILKQQSGSILVISAIMLPVMLGCLGFAYDFGNLYMHKSRLQNIVDAAALAGGRAYLKSQEKSAGRDETDKVPGLNGNENEIAYHVGDSVESIEEKRGNTLHADADRAADDYILKNLVNLGTTVKSDIFSHYALRAEGMSSKVFYRVGIYENVPLHFLSLILNKRQQKVRAGTVVLVDEGKGIVKGNTLFDKLFTVKDELKLESGVPDIGIIVDKPDKTGIQPGNKTKGAKIQATFDGEIAFAVDKANWDPSKAGDYFYTKAEKDYQLRENISINEMNTDYSNPNMGGKAVRDNSISIESNVSGFLNKFKRPHNDLKRNTMRATLTEFKLGSMNNYKNLDNLVRKHYDTTDIDSGEITSYFHMENKEGYDYFVFCVPRYGTEEADSEESGTGTEGTATEIDYLGKAYVEFNKAEETYACLHTEGYNFTYKKIANNGTISYPNRDCYTYVLDNEGNKVFCYRNTDKNTKIKIDGKDKIAYFWFYTKKYLPDDVKPTNTKYQCNTWNPTNIEEIKEENSNRIKAIKYTYVDPDDGREKNFKIDVVKDSRFSRYRQINEPQIKNATVFHWEQEAVVSNGKSELKISVNDDTGDEYNPVYLILTGGKGGTRDENLQEEAEIPTQIKIIVSQSNKRPLIFCNLTKNEISEFTIANGKTFKGMIYSPFAKVVNQYSSGSGSRKFVGSIIAKELEIHDPYVSWSHKNFVEDDSDLNQISDLEAEKQEKRKQDAIDFAIAELGITEDDWKTPGWFGSRTPAEQDQIKQKWKQARQRLWETEGLDMPDWPWEDGGKGTDKDQHHYGISNNEIDNTGEKLRIINYRTEYTLEPYINPFNNLYLSE